MSSFLDSTGLSELATKLKAYFAKKDGSYPNMNVGNAYGINRAVISSGEYNIWWGIKLTHRFTRTAAISVRCLILRAYNGDNAGIVDLIIKERSDNTFDIIAQTVCGNTDNQYFGKVVYTLDNGVSYIGIRLSYYYSKVIPMIIGDTESEYSSENKSVLIEFGSFGSVANSLTRYDVIARRLTYTTDFEQVGSPSIPVYVSSSGEVTACTNVAASTASALDSIDQTDYTSFFFLGYMNGDTSKRARKAVNLSSYHSDADGTIVVIGKQNGSGKTYKGRIRLASGDGHYTDLRTANAGDDRDTVIAMPVTGYDRVIPVYPATGSGVGSASQPVYVDANGQVQPCEPILLTSTGNVDNAIPTTFGHSVWHTWYSANPPTGADFVNGTAATTVMQSIKTHVNSDYYRQIAYTASSGIWTRARNGGSWTTWTKWTN